MVLFFDTIFEVEVDGDKTHVVINNLEPSTEYRVCVLAENAAGRSPRSQPVYARTHGTCVLKLH